MSNEVNEKFNHVILSSLTIFNKNLLPFFDFEIYAYQNGKRLAMSDGICYTYLTLSHESLTGSNCRINSNFVKFDYLGEFSDVFTIHLDLKIQYSDKNSPILLVVLYTSQDDIMPIAFGHYSPENPSNILLEYIHEGTRIEEVRNYSIREESCCKLEGCCCSSGAVCIKHIDCNKNMFDSLVEKIAKDSSSSVNEVNKLSKLSRVSQYYTKKRVCTLKSVIFGYLRLSPNNPSIRESTELPCVYEYNYNEWNINRIIEIGVDSKDVLKHILYMPFHGIKSIDDSSTAIFSITRNFLEENLFIKSLLFNNVNMLSHYHTALPIFLRAVDWVDESEFGFHWLFRWNPPGISQVLDLLSQDFANLTYKGHLNPSLVIRQYAVRQLDRFCSLRCYITPLILSLKLEDPGGPLSTYLLDRRKEDLKLGFDVYWSLLSFNSVDDPIVNSFIQAVDENLINTINLHHKLRESLLRLADETKDIRTSYEKNNHLNQNKLFDLVSDVIELDGGKMPFPLNISINIDEIITEKCYVMRSYQYPICISCYTDDGERGFIFKYGDDLRQDKIVTEIIGLFEMICNNEGIEFPLLRYQVLPFSDSDGIVEFIQDTKPLSSIFKLSGGIAEFLCVKDIIYSELLDSPVFSNFVNSLAAYSMITYFLQVGDRHLDNLLLQTTGKLIHVDFGYMFGANPKLFGNTHFRICSEIVEFIGGIDSPGFELFRSRCYIMFALLYRHSNLLFSFMYNYSMADLKDFNSINHGYRDKMENMANRIIITSASNLREYVDRLINESVNSITPIIIEKVHDLALYWR